MNIYIALFSKRIYYTSSTKKKTFLIYFGTFQNFKKILNTYFLCTGNGYYKRDIDRIAFKFRLANVYLLFPSVDLTWDFREFTEFSCRK